MTLTDPSLLKTQLFINGEWVESDSGDTFPVYNPATGCVLNRVANGGRNETHYAISCARNAMKLWQRKTAEFRADMLRSWHQLILENRDDLAIILTLEQGKPLNEAKAEVEYAASYVQWFAEEAKRLYGDVIPNNHPSQRLLVIKQPVGVVGAVTPWNFPCAMVTRKIAPALAAGCTIVVKPAEATPLSALALAALAERAGFPKGILSIVIGENAAEIGTELTKNPLLRKLSFTGSTQVGKHLIKQCADTVKKVSMELGGNAPFIIFEDADLELAVKCAIDAKFRNAGQTCVCANRFIVHTSVYDDFVEQFTAKTQRHSLGNGLEDHVTIGPLINKEASDRMNTLVQDARSMGAELIIGGEPSELGNCYYPPTIMTNVTPDMRLFNEEIFGPIAPITKFGSEEEALQLANMTETGLAAYLFTQNIVRIWQFSEELENGIVGINEGIISNEAAPFGGIKQSGSGREGSKYGLEDYTEIKYLCMGGIEY